MQIVILALILVGIPWGIRYWWKQHESRTASVPIPQTKLLDDAQAEVDAILRPYREAAAYGSAASGWPSAGNAQSATQTVVLNRSLRGLPSWIDADGTVY